MKRFKLSDALLLLLAVASVSVAMITVNNKIALQTVTSNSMEPYMQAGDILLTRQVSTDSVQLRDVVVLPIPESRDLRYTHRVIELEKESGNIVIKTKGDANPIPDEWSLEITSEQIPKVIAVIPSAPVLDSPIGRRTLFLSLLGGGVLLLLLGFWRIVKGRAT